MKVLLKLAASAAAALVLGVVGCGGSFLAGGGIGGTGITSGPISAFGSIFVNGIEFDTSAADIRVENQPADAGALGLGMVVTVTGSVNANGITGTAERVDYRKALSGPLSAINASPDGSGLLTVLGQTLSYDPTTVLEARDSGITKVADIPLDALVEASGFTDGSGVIFTTRIDVRAAAWSGETIEIKGIVQALTTDSFRIGELTLVWNRATMLPAEPLANGLYVEVESDSGFDAQGRLIADRIEIEGDGAIGVGDEGEEVDVSGVVTGALEGDRFHLNGQPVRLSGQTKFEGGSAADLLLGAEVEVSGTIFDGEILAEEIELESEGSEGSDDHDDSDD